MGSAQSSRLANVLGQHRRVGFDTAVLIYYLQDHPLFAPVAGNFFDLVEDGQLTAVTSVVTWLEVLVRPLRDGATRQVDHYRGMLRSFPNLEVRSIDIPEAERAALLRSRYRIATPDALQLAACLEAGCTAFLTNDTDLARLAEPEMVEVVTLKQCLEV